MVLGILNTIRGNLGISDKRRGEAGSSSRITYEISDFMSADVAVVASSEMILGELTVLPQRSLAFGYDDNTGFSENQGTIYMDLKNAAAASLNGEVVLSVSDNEGDRNDVVFRGSVSDLTSGSTDITKRIKFPLLNPENRGFANYQDKLVLKFKSTTTDTVSATNSVAKISGTTIKTNL